MPRWESDAQGRLERAALELFETQGFERTTVAQIARTAGLTERSFYRYFPDKREVLFAGNELEAHLAARVEAADPGLTPIEALLNALGTADEVFQSREFLLRRVKVIAASPALAERDLIKLADIADALVRALEHRGVEPGEHASSSTWRSRSPGAPRPAGWPTRTRPSPSSSPRPPPNCVRWSRHRPRRSAEPAVRARVPGRAWSGGNETPPGRERLRPSEVGRQAHRRTPSGALAAVLDLDLDLSRPKLWCSLSRAA